MTTLEQKARHLEAKERARVKSICTAYHTALAEGDLDLIDLLWNKYPEFHEEFNKYTPIASINSPAIVRIVN